MKKALIAGAVLGLLALAACSSEPNVETPPAATPSPAAATGAEISSVSSIAAPTGTEDSSEDGVPRGLPSSEAGGDQ